MSDLFKFHKLNLKGQQKSYDIGYKFQVLVEELEKTIGEEGCNLLYWDKAKSKLEEACFYTKKSMATQFENQE